MDHLRRRHPAWPEMQVWRRQTVWSPVTVAEAGTPLVETIQAAEEDRDRLDTALIEATRDLDRARQHIADLDGQIEGQDQALAAADDARDTQAAEIERLRGLVHRLADVIVAQHNRHTLDVVVDTTAWDQAVADDRRRRAAHHDRGTVPASAIYADDRQPAADSDRQPADNATANPPTAGDTPPTARYRHRALEIEAAQVTIDQAREVAVWCGGAPWGTDDAPEVWIDTSEGERVASTGAWIIRESGTYRVLYDVEFRALYEPASGADFVDSFTTPDMIGDTP
ncbi:hypothetical protein ACIBSV_12185 [Embleya sp. NPDC050154]|uniref:hypothetical protein n=1 Tax=Embleya sp. NPDC050154 TaxID=3363988 RepID=UPI0037A4697E